MWSDAYSRCLEHLRKPRIVADTRVEDADAGVEEGHAGAERGDAALEGCGGAIVHVDAQSLGFCRLVLLCHVQRSSETCEDDAHQ